MTTAKASAASTNESGICTGGLGMARSIRAARFSLAKTGKRPTDPRIGAGAWVFQVAPTGGGGEQELANSYQIWYVSVHDAEIVLGSAFLSH